MAKESGLGDRLLVGGHDLGGDVLSVGNIGGGPAPLELTGIVKSAFQRIGGVRDGRMEFAVAWNPEDDPEAAHYALKGLPTTDVILSYLHGSTLGNAAACLNAKQANYDLTRPQDGSLVGAVEALNNQYGLEWGRQLTAGMRTDTTATNGSSVDDGAASSFGLQAYLQVTEFTGTSVTVKLQSSSDNGGADAFADVTGGSFSAVSADHQFQRIQTARDAAIERYLRVVTTGTFSEAVFSVVVVRNATQVLF